jgi:hypothetical protein
LKEHCKRELLVYCEPNQRKLSRVLYGSSAFGRYGRLILKPYLSNLKGKGCVSRQLSQHGRGKWQVLPDFQAKRDSCEAGWHPT